MRKNISVSLISALLLLCLAQIVWANDREKAELCVQEGTITVKEMMMAPDRAIPSDLLQRAKAVAIFPSTLKGGFIVGGTFGRGMVLSRQADGKFGPPAFYSMGGGSVGLQIGGQSTDIIMLIMNQKGLDGLIRNKFKIGAELSAAAGPVGRKSEAALSAMDRKADIYSYSRSGGLFAGLAVEGVGLQYNHEYNNAYYGQKVNINDLIEAKVPVPSTAQELCRQLDRFSSL